MRHQVNNFQVEQTLTTAINAYREKLNEKGTEIFVSGHEIYGVLQEEVEEFFDEVKANSSAERKEAELLDIIVAAMHGIASIESGKMDW